MIMEQNCKNCLNAYNCTASHDVRCVNLEFDQQFDDAVNVSVTECQSCGRWSLRRDDQSKLNFHQVIQLDLFGNLI